MPATRPSWEEHSQVWLGVQDRLVREAKDIIATWLKAESALLDREEQIATEILLVIGTCLRFVTGEQTTGAFTMPHFDASRICFQFLICIELPQQMRTAEQERDWMKAALIHELEHVWQFVTLNDTLLESHWLSLAEMSAVYAEITALGAVSSCLDYGADFLRCAPLGITNVVEVSYLSPQPYWTFPFMEHLASVRKGIHREIWSRPGMSAHQGDTTLPESQNRPLKQGPWVALNGILNENGSTLRDEWIAFSKTLLDPTPSSAAAKIVQRFAPRLPTLRLELNEKTNSENLGWEWKTWPLSAHWIHLTIGQGTRWKISWIAHSFSSADIVVLARTENGEWREVSNDSLILSDQMVDWDILLIDATLLDMTNVSAIAGHVCTSTPNLTVSIQPG